MNILLDTHIALWAILDDGLLPQKAKTMILDPENNIFYSTVSTWEVLLKHTADPKNLYISVQEFIERCNIAGFLSINLTNKHILSVESLARTDDTTEHKDPFDRLLLSQAKSEKMGFMTHDKKILSYSESSILYV